MNGKLAASEADARNLVIQRAIAAGCAVESPAATAFAYWNGTTQEQGLSAAAVADRIRAGSASGTHMVWTPELGAWVDARSVPTIAALVPGAPPPPPPPPKVG